MPAGAHRRGYRLLHLRVLLLPEATRHIFPLTKVTKAATRMAAKWPRVETEQIDHSTKHIQTRFLAPEAVPYPSSSLMNPEIKPLKQQILRRIRRPPKMPWAIPLSLAESVVRLSKVGRGDKDRTKHWHSLGRMLQRNIRFLSFGEWGP